VPHKVDELTDSCEARVVRAALREPALVRLLVPREAPVSPPELSLEELVLIPSDTIIASDLSSFSEAKIGSGDGRERVLG
jgi:hypothetical protein